MEIRPVGFELFHAGGRTDWRTDMTKLIIAFRNFANAPKMCSYVRCSQRNKEIIKIMETHS